MNETLARAAALIKSGKAGEARAMLLPLVGRHPKHAGLAFLLGNACWAEGDTAAAEYHLRRARGLEPGRAEIPLMLGEVLLTARKPTEAAAALREAIRMAPGHARAARLLTDALLQTDDLAGAEAAAEAGVRGSPGEYGAWKSLSLVLLLSGRTDRCVARMIDGLARVGHLPEFHSDLCFAANYATDLTPERVREIHDGFGRATMARIRTEPPPFENSVDAERPIVLGFLSGDMRRHSVSFFLEPLLESLDRTRFRPVLFHSGEKRDEVTERLAALAPLHHCYATPIDDLPGLIRSQRVDVLFELAGHTADHRLYSLARKPAPVIATYLGYPNTTGLPTVDYRLVDHLTDPARDAAGTARVGLSADYPGAEAYHSERLWRLDRPFLCYSPARDPACAAVEPGPLPADAGGGGGGGVTFGSFNAVQKLNRPLIGLWARVLRETPGSRMVLKADFRLSAAREMCLGWFGEAGVDPSRVSVLRRVDSAAEHLRLYGGVDIALDTFPYHGTTTTCEALWMGVPVVSRIGPTHASRVGLSILSAVGLEDLAAGDEDGFVRAASGLAADRDRLRALRAMLRPRMAGSALLDKDGFARAFGDAVIGMWRSWVAGRSGS